MQRRTGVCETIEGQGVIIPAILYKYRAFTGWTHEIFEKSELYFSRPRDFNDPFDSVVRFLYKGNHCERKRFLRDWHSCSPRRQAIHSQKVMMRNGQDLKNIAQIFRDEVEAIRGRVAVCCFTAEPKNVLMWAHYALKHTGFCLGFQTGSEFFRLARPITYKPKLNCLNVLKVAWNELMTQTADAILTKAEDWDYEKEWRIIEFDGDPGPRQFPPEAVVRVILGCRISAPDRQRIEQWCAKRSPRPTLYEATVKDEEFGLEIPGLPA